MTLGLAEIDVLALFPWFGPSSFMACNSVERTPFRRECLAPSAKNLTIALSPAKQEKSCALKLLFTTDLRLPLNQVEGGTSSATSRHVHQVPGPHGLHAC